MPLDFFIKPCIIITMENECKRKLLETEYIVEATSYESLMLWQEYSLEGAIRGRRPANFELLDWKQEGMGWGICIGHLEKRPVYVSVLWNIINGHRVLFVEMTSQVADYVMMEDWLEKVCPNSISKTDAMNFPYTDLLKG